MFYQNVHPKDVLIAIKSGIFPNDSIEYWSNSVSDTVIVTSQLIIIFIIILTIVLIYYTLKKIYMFR